MERTLLVTGGAGFIGSCFIKYMLKKYPYRIINLDDLSYAGDLANLEEVKEEQNYRFVKGDICDRQIVTQLFLEEDISGVINFAAESHVDRSIEDPEIFLRTNVLGTQVLLDCARRAWNLEPDKKGSRAYRDGVKFLQVSTDEVYGSLGAEGYFREDSPICPNSPYSASKASADLVVRAFYETYGLPYNITRCSNNYGPYQYPEKLIPLMIQKALKDEPLPVYGDGKQIRDWLYVEDHCSAIDIVLHEGRVAEVYNVGGNNEEENIRIVQLILERLHKPESLIAYVEDRPGHDRRYAIDSSKITKELGWYPKYPFKEGMALTIDWYVNRF